MTCCTDGSCPMHKGEHRVPASPHTISQAEADACCAAATENPSDPSGRPVLASITVAVLGHAVVIPSTVFAPGERSQWQLVVPLPDPSPPKHVLHAVFLV